MRLERVEVWGFRNLSALSVDLSPGLNHFSGPNGAGKTAFLEAIHLLFRGRSFRTNRVANVIAKTEQRLMVRAELNADGLRRSAAASRDRDDGRDLRLDGVAGRRVSDLAGLLPIQLMLPETSDLVFGSPGLRRSFIDWGAFHVKREHLEDLRSYQRALRQRNALLREARGDIRKLPVALESWNMQLLEFGGRTDLQRREYVDGVKPLVQEVMQQLAPELDVTLSYEPGWPSDQTFEETLVETVLREVKSGATQSGPHRAELRLTVAQGRASDVLSRGQAKLVASGLHLAQARKTREQTGADSLFLIDDVGAELDEAHRLNFFRLLSEEQCQVMTTGTAQLEAMVGYELGFRTFHVEQGECRLIDG